MYLVRLGSARVYVALMLGNKMDFSSCAIWIGFHKFSQKYYFTDSMDIHILCT